MHAQPAMRESATVSGGSTPTGERGRPYVRLSVNLSQEVAQALREVADRHGCSITEAVRRCVSTQKYIEDNVEAGAKILLEAPNQPLKELVFVTG
jgi:hypothetical protein